MTVYVIEFGESIGNKSNRRGQAKFYVGYCENGREEKRLAEHRKGNGASITRAVAQKGIEMNIVLTIDGDRKVERWFKNKKDTPRIVKRYRETGKLPIPKFQ